MSKMVYVKREKDFIYYDGQSYFIPSFTIRQAARDDEKNKEILQQTLKNLGFEGVVDYLATSEKFLVSGHAKKQEHVKVWLMGEEGRHILLGWLSRYDKFCRHVFDYQVLAQQEDDHLHTFYGPATEEIDIDEYDIVEGMFLLENPYPGVVSLDVNGEKYFQNIYNMLFLNGVFSYSAFTASYNHFADLYDDPGSLVDKMYGKTIPVPTINPKNFHWIKIYESIKKYKLFIYCHHGAFVNRVYIKKNSLFFTHFFISNHRYLAHPAWRSHLQYSYTNFFGWPRKLYHSPENRGKKDPVSHPFVSEAAFLVDIAKIV